MITNAAPRAPQNNQETQKSKNYEGGLNALRDFVTFKE